MRLLHSSLVAAAALAALEPARVGAVTFDFEDLPVGTVVKAQYGARGVLFFDAYIDSDPHAHSGTRVLRAVKPGTEVFTAVPLAMTFTSPQARVAFRAGNLPGGTGSGVLKVFDGSGALLAEDGPKPVPDDSFDALFRVQLPSARIARAEFHVEGSAFEAIDDLVVEGGEPPVTPTSPPQVAITSPTDGAILPVAPTTIRGTVTGESVLDTIVLRVSSGKPPDSSAPPSDNVVALSGTGASRTFALEYGLITGTYTVTAIATNTANLQGTATVRFASLPDPIRARYEAAGGAATFGALRFGASDAACAAAVYDRGLIAAVGDTTFVVLGRIFEKWMATRETGSPMSRLGCPIAEEREALGGARAQDFSRGRIYASDGAAAYVPQVLRDAIETLGGEATTGIATADPTDSTGAMQTWVFQRFVRPGEPVEPSTLEIRGSPPMLYVERVGDGLEDLHGAGVPLVAGTATVVRTFPCEGNLGPCTVVKPTSSPTIPDGAPHCGGRYPVTSVTEWAPVQTDHTQTAVAGWVHESKMACEDNPLTHDHLMENTGCTVSAFPSDWNVYLRPMAPYGGLITSQQTYLDIEFEALYAAYFFAGWGWPIAGDLVYANGRWIIDCGHEPFKAEIHPPFLMTHARTVQRSGTPRTLAEIWVTGYYPGDPIELELWPPPRPTPDAVLTVVKPFDSDAAYGVQVTFTTSVSGVRVRFTAQHRKVPVDASGKMNWQTGRGYEGEWEVYWSK